MKPTWARYKAMDADGAWFWYEDNPVLDEEHLEWANATGKVALCDKLVFWRQSVQEVSDEHTPKT